MSAKRILIAAAAAITLAGTSLGTARAHDTREAGAEGAHAITAGDLAISGPWARAMLPGQPSGGGYLVIENAGGGDDRLVAASSPRAGKVEIHTMTMQDDVMVMRPVEGGLAVPAGETVTLEPGGLHIMFMQVETPFAEGETVPVTLQFEKAGAVTVDLPVGPARGGEPAHDHGGHDMDDDMGGATDGKAGDD